MREEFPSPSCFWLCTRVLFRGTACKSTELVAPNLSSTYFQTETAKQSTKIGKLIVNFSLTLTSPKKCSLAGNRSDPMSFSSCEAFAPLRTKSNILIDLPAARRFWCSISAEKFDPECDQIWRKQHIWQLYSMRGSHSCFLSNAAMPPLRSAKMPANIIHYTYRFSLDTSVKS